MWIVDIVRFLVAGVDGWLAYCDKSSTGEGRWMCLIMPLVKHVNGRGSMDGMDDVEKRQRAFAWEGMWRNNCVARADGASCVRVGWEMSTFVGAVGEASDEKALFLAGRRCLQSKGPWMS